jgi:hypothetical protein
VCGSGIDSSDPGPVSVTGAFEHANDTLAQFFICLRTVNSISKIIFWHNKMLPVTSERVLMLNVEEKWETSIGTEAA